MKRGESRFFLNWKMSPELSHYLHQSQSDSDRTELIKEWVADLDLIHDDYERDYHYPIIVQYFENVYDFTKK